MYRFAGQWRPDEKPRGARPRSAVSVLSEKASTYEGGGRPNTAAASEISWRTLPAAPKPADIVADSAGRGRLTVSAAAALQSELSRLEGTRRSLREAVEQRLRSIEGGERKRVQEEAQAAAAVRAGEAQRLMQDLLDSRLAALEADKVRYGAEVAAATRAEAASAHAAHAQSLADRLAAAEDATARAVEVVAAQLRVADADRVALRAECDRRAAKVDRLRKAVAADGEEKARLVAEIARIRGELRSYQTAALDALSAHVLDFKRAVNEATSPTRGGPDDDADLHASVRSSHGVSGSASPIREELEFDDVDDARGHTIGGPVGGAQPGVRASSGAYRRSVGDIPVTVSTVPAPVTIVRHEYSDGGAASRRGSAAVHKR